jgi:dTDP-4-dehydrorhamnose 3,5-epimerase
MSSDTPPTTPRGEPLAIAGVTQWRSPSHRDERGAFTEIFRREWGPGVDPLQWNVVRSASRVLRGVHVHVRHSDYLVVVAGRMRLGLYDLRRDSPTGGRALRLDLDGDAPSAVVIPPGVAHGFYFPEPGIHVYSVSEYWNPAEEMGCHFADPALGIDWGLEGEPILSPRDAALPPLVELAAKWERFFRDAGRTVV